MYIDGINVASSDSIVHNPSDLGATTRNYIGKSQYPADANFNGKIDDFRIFKIGLSALDIQNIMGESLTDAEVVALNKQSLDLGDTFAVETDLKLITEGSNEVIITWSSSNTNYLSDNGKVTRPLAGQGDVVVELTAILTKNADIDTKVFQVSILEEGATPYSININIKEKGVNISPSLYGIFFEDINYALDGGLYPELVQNRSFEFSNIVTREYNGLYSWNIIESGVGSGIITTSNIDPLNENNTNYLKLTVTVPGDGVGVWNTGFPNENTTGIPGMVVIKNEKYEFSMFVRSSDYTGPIEVTIEGENGTVYAKEELNVKDEKKKHSQFCKKDDKGKFNNLTDQWSKFFCTLQTNTSYEKAKLVVKIKGIGTIDMDMVSLFPKKTWHNRRNGVRYDLGKKLAEMNPKFVRFPGGCIVEGDRIDNMYKWKDTVGKLEERKMNYDLWYSVAFPYYHQSFGIGFFEYFQMAEDLNAEPVPVVNAGLTCQARRPVAIPLRELQPFIDNALDLIEFANGGIDTEWGKLRAEMGHPKPFNLKYLAIGNENWNQVYFERYEAFAAAIREKYPEIKLITSSGPQAEDSLFIEARQWIQNGRADANLVDEHYYRDPGWFYNNINRYDNYDRKLPKIFIGEYASRENTMRNALAEAAFMTAIEENADIIELASYAPLFAKQNFIQWTPDAIWFNNKTSFGSVNYHVQKMYMNNTGTITHPSELLRRGESSYVINGKIGIGGYNTATTYDNVLVVDNNTNAILFSDDFSGGDSRWTKVAGNWKVVGTEYVQTSTNTPSTLAYANTADMRNYTLTLKAKKTAGYEGFLVYVGVRDNFNYLRWNLGGYGNTRGSFERVQNGVVTTISEFDMAKFYSVNTGEWYDLKLVVSGNNVKCYVNMELAFDIVYNPKNGPLYTITSEDTKTGDIIIKVVNSSSRLWKTKINLNGVERIYPIGKKIVLKGNSLTGQNSFENPENVIPVVTKITGLSNSFIESFEPYSVNIIRIKTRRR